jgi:hypothetical protein
MYKISIHNHQSHQNLDQKPGDNALFIHLRVLSGKQHFFFSLEVKDCEGGGN